jgi:phosphinothricin acetyltransferase
MGIRSITKKDWSQIREIYQKGIETKVATFEMSPPEIYEEWSQKLDRDNVFVHETNGKIDGWISLSKFSSRCCYEGVGEVSIYIHPDAKRNGVGTKLYDHLEESAKSSGYWTIQAQLFTNNLASKSFFEDQGFRQVGVREKIGQLNNQWIDNYLYEKNFN